MTAFSRLPRRAFPLTSVVLGALFLLVLLCIAQTGTGQQKFGSGEWPVFSGSVDWPVYRGDPKGNQYAALAQINATNDHSVNGLRTTRSVKRIQIPAPRPTRTHNTMAFES